jgi:predicted site-specific integrase-resolvase
MDLVLNTFGTCLTKDNDCFMVLHKDGKQRIPPADLRGICISRGAQISSDARVSTQEQFLDNQIHLLKEFGCEKVFTDIAGGVREDRNGLKEMTSYLRAGDMVVVYKIDRIFRKILFNI